MNNSDNIIPKYPIQNNTIDWDTICSKGRDNFLRRLSFLSSSSSSGKSKSSGKNRMGLSYNMPYLNAEYELVAKIYKRDVKFQFRKVIDKVPLRQSKPTSKRNAISHYSYKSVNRLKFLLGNTADLWKGMITLTYPAEFPKDGRVCMRHLNAFLQFLRRRNIRYVWSKEFQERGALHYHIFVDKYIRKEDIALRWYNIVGSGDEKHLLAGTRVEAIRSQGLIFHYISAYISKLTQKQVPDDFVNVGRFWGASRDILPYEEVHFGFGTYIELSRRIRKYRRWYTSKCRSWGFKWKHRCLGFTMVTGAKLFAVRC